MILKEHNYFRYERITDIVHTQGFNEQENVTTELSTETVARYANYLMNKRMSLQSYPQKL